MVDTSADERRELFVSSSQAVPPDPPSAKQAPLVGDFKMLCRCAFKGVCFLLTIPRKTSYNLRGT